MCVGLPPSPEELEKMARANRKYDEIFRAEHPFLSLFNNLLYVLFVGGFFSSLAMLYGLLVVLLPVRMNIYFLLFYSVQLQPNFA